MTRDAFRNRLDQLDRDLQEMGAAVQGLIAGAIDALLQRRVDVAQKVIEGDEVVDRYYAQIEALCLEILMLQQPVAGDLRQVASTLKLITDLERIGDYAVNIAETVSRMGDAPLITQLERIPKMAGIAQTMVQEAMEAFRTGDRSLAEAMIQRDHEVDRLHRESIERLTHLMESDSKNVRQGVQLLLVSRALERIGDHATNLGEWMIYQETGKRADLNQ